MKRLILSLFLITLTTQALANNQLLQVKKQLYKDIQTIHVKITQSIQQLSKHQQQLLRSEKSLNSMRSDLLNYGGSHCYKAAVRGISNNKKLTHNHKQQLLRLRQLLVPLRAQTNRSKGVVGLNRVVDRINKIIYENNQLNIKTNKIIQQWDYGMENSCRQFLKR